MKISRIIVALLVLLGVSVHTHGIVNGYETPDCSGDFVIADSLATLIYWDGKEFNGKVWNFESYQKLTDIEDGEDEENIGDCIRFSSSPLYASLIQQAKVYKPVFLPAFILRLEGDFDAEKNQKLLDLWKQKTMHNPYINGQALPHTNTIFSSETPAEWDTTQPGYFYTENNKTYRVYGEVIVDDPLKINIYAHNIRIKANSEDIDFEDFVISTQMEEHIHALQIKALETDLRNELAGKPKEYQLNEEEFQVLFKIVIKAEKLIMDKEAKEFRQNVLFPYVFGRPAPMILDPEFTIPNDYEENRKKFRELAIKNISENADISEMIEYTKLLVDWIVELETPTSVVNPDYRKQQEREDSEEHE
ncbi:MAG: hypothetical protein OXH84_02340 [Gammaproteobacteria bacterium]|nr:hypothetical protein [Gammaproteobacteria bacterium]